MTSLVEVFFGLKQPAFSVSKDSGPVLMTEPLRSVATFLRRNLTSGTRIMCVLGPAGIGKSSVARVLPKLTSGEWRVASLSGRAECWDDLHRVLMQEFGVDGDRMTRIGLQQAHAEHGKLLIVVDDAQFLRPEWLERICILPQLHTYDAEPVIQVALLVEPDAVPAEDLRPLRAWLDRDAYHVMQPIPNGDVHLYVDALLRKAGWLGKPLISESGARALHRYCLGNPRRLSAACTKILERAVGRGMARIDAEFVVECLGADQGEHLEPLSASVGADLFGSFKNETVPAPCGAGGESDANRYWGEEMRAPLTSDYFEAASGLELADVVQESLGLLPGEPTPEPKRSIARTTILRPIAPLDLDSHRSESGSVVMILCVLATAIALYTSRIEVGDALVSIGVNLPTAVEGFEGREFESKVGTLMSPDRKGLAVGPVAQMPQHGVTPGKAVDLSAALGTRAPVELAVY